MKLSVIALSVVCSAVTFAASCGHKVTVKSMDVSNLHYNSLFGDNPSDVVFFNLSAFERTNEYFNNTLDVSLDNGDVFSKSKLKIGYTEAELSKLETISVEDFRIHNPKSILDYKSFGELFSFGEHIALSSVESVSAYSFGKYDPNLYMRIGMSKKSDGNNSQIVQGSLAFKDLDFKNCSVDFESLQGGVPSEKDHQVRCSDKESALEIELKLATRKISTLLVRQPDYGFGKVVVEIEKDCK